MVIPKATWPHQPSSYPPFHSHNVFYQRYVSIVCFVYYLVSVLLFRLRRKQREALAIERRGRRREELCAR